MFAWFRLGEYVTAWFGKHHDAIFNAIPRGERGVRLNILAPRGSAKTTAIARTYLLHCLYYKAEYEAMGMVADNYIVLVCENEKMAQSRIKDVHRIVRANPHFGWLRGKETWGVSDMVTSNGTRVVPKGREAPIRGELFKQYRPSLIALDDIDNAESVRNPVMRKKNLLWFDTDVGYAGDAETNVILVETVKHEESIAGTLRKRPGWRTLFFRAIEHPADLRHPTAEGLWEEWERIYTDATNEGAKADAQAFYDENKVEMTDGVKELWPEKLNYLEVRKNIANEGYFPVMRELQNETRDPSTEIFDMSKAVKFTVEADGLLRSDGRLVRWQKICGCTIYLDWAGSGDSQKSCFAAIAVLFWEEMPNAQAEHPLAKHHAYVSEVWLDRCPPTEQIEQLFIQLERAKAVLAQVRQPGFVVAVERYIDKTNTIHDYISRVFEDCKRKYNADVGLEFLPRYKDKMERIITLDAPIKNGWLAFHENLNEEIWRELRQFPNSDFVDGVDALEGATELVCYRAPEREIDEFGRVRRPMPEVLGL